jgi:hypothetical protein
MGLQLQTLPTASHGRQESYVLQVNSFFQQVYFLALARKRVTLVLQTGQGP